MKSRQFSSGKNFGLSKLVVACPQESSEDSCDRLVEETTDASLVLPFLTEFKRLSGSREILALRRAPALG
jgi:hypothetical protein